ncbi:MAG TPA: ABC transporter permease [Gaiellales bacterium]|nr:ABC transporter permease [Gaiellales bacterium]
MLGTSGTLLESLERRSRTSRIGSGRITLAIGILILGTMIVASLAAPLITSAKPDAIDPLHPLLHPLSPGHLLGTDSFGRDILSRILYGGRIDLLIGFGATSVTAVIGTAIGLASGYFGGWVDSIIMRIVDLFFAFPFFVLVIAIVAMLGPSIFNMFVAIWLTSWISYARITRGHTLVAKRQEYTLAARALGYKNRRVMLRHILPNVVSYVIIFAMVDAVGNIVLGSSLGFLGLGAQPPSPEWGVMISDGQNYLLTAWWLSTFPGIAIILVGVGFSLIGDGLADILRPGD